MISVSVAVTATRYTPQSTPRRNYPGIRHTLGHRAITAHDAVRQITRDPRQRAGGVVKAHSSAHAGVATEVAGLTRVTRVLLSRPSAHKDRGVAQKCLAAWDDR